MKNFAILLARLMRQVGTVALWVSAVCMVLMTVVILWQVYSRYILNSSPSWSEATALLLMGWFVLLGATVGIRNSDHLGFQILLHHAPQKIRQVMRMVNYGLMAMFGALMAVNGLKLVRGTWDGQMPGVPLPQGVDYIPLVAGGVLVAIFSAEKFLDQLIFFGEPDPTDEDAPIVEGSLE